MPITADQALDFAVELITLEEVGECLDAFFEPLAAGGHFQKVLAFGRGETFQGGDGL